jgi:HTH-type transcriptional regulator, glycine betaine synthesis regulator
VGLASSPTPAIRSNGTSHPVASDSATADRRRSAGEGLIRPNGRAADVVQFEQALVGFFVDAADLLGVPKSVAAIYGICFASPEPLGFSEIQDRLDISAGSISQGLRILREVGALKLSDRVPSSLRSDPTTPPEAKRRDFYEPDLELRNLIARFIQQRVDRQLNAGRSSLRKVLKLVPSSTNDSADLLNARLKSLQTWHDKARAVLPVIRAFLKLT